jgi:hypothetical protein
MGKLRTALLIITLLALAGAAGTRAGVPAAGAAHWEIVGTLTEACTCMVPCTCNFGEGPSPHHYCWTVFSLQIDKGQYGDVKLDSLHLAVGHAQKMWVAYIDDRATPEQSRALKTIALRVLKDTPFRGQFETAHIVQQIGDSSARVQIGQYGGFETNYIMGMDKKTPVVVENNTTFNIPRSTKTKTTVFRYRDAHGNDIDTGSTNGNQGKFDWTDRTSTYLW